MSGWIKLWKDMVDDPRLMRAAAAICQRYTTGRSNPYGPDPQDLAPAELLRLYVSCSLGALVRLWCYADEHIYADNSLPISASTLDAFLNLDGFYEAMPREWITQTDDGRVVLPGYCEKNQVVTREKRRVKQQEYTRRWRASRNGKSIGEHEVSISHNKSEVSQPPHTMPLDQDLDQDSDLKKKTHRSVRASKRCPEGWVPSPEVWTQLREECPRVDLDRELRKFRDNTFGVARSDWDATFRNWCRKAADQIAPRPSRFDELTAGLPKEGM